MRFFLSHSAKVGDTTQLEESEQHHLMDVYRCQIGDEVELFDMKGNQYLAYISSCKGRKVFLEITQQTKISAKLPVEVILAQGIIKSQHWDLLLEKAMELGLDYLIPMTTQHLACGKQTAGNPDRWQKIMISAAKQCGRNSLIQVEPIQTFSHVLETSKNIPLRLLAHKDSKFPCLRKVLENLPSTPEKILVIVGPEGGLTEQELHQAESEGCQIFTMGGNTLRAETAAWAILSNINFFFYEKRQLI